MLVWREKIVNIRIGEFIGQFTVLHHDERSMIVAIDQDEVIKRYSTSQIRPFIEQTSMLNNSIVERKIEDRHYKTCKEPDEPVFDGDNEQINVDQQSYGKQSITDDSDNVTKNCDQEITQVREILEQTESMMKEDSNEYDQCKTSPNDISRRVTRQQTQSARRMATRTRSQSQIYMISIAYLNQTSQSLTLFTGSPQCRLTEIIKPSDPRANCTKMIEAKYAEIRDLIKRGTFRAVLRAELSDSANLITSRYVLAIKSEENKEERNKARYVAGGHLGIMKDYLVHAHKLFNVYQCA